MEKRSSDSSIAPNDYGSFSGSVTAPRDRLMGRMTLSVSEWTRAVRRRSRSKNTNVRSSRSNSIRPRTPRSSAATSSCEGKRRPTPARRSTMPKSAGESSARFSIRFGGSGVAGGCRRSGAAAKRSLTARRQPRPTARSTSSSRRNPIRRFSKNPSRRSGTRSMPM